MDLKDYSLKELFEIRDALNRLVVVNAFTMNELVFLNDKLLEVKEELEVRK